MNVGRFFYCEKNVYFRDPSEVFQLVKRVTDDTAAEPCLLSVLQHFVLIRDDDYARQKRLHID